VVMETREIGYDGSVFSNILFEIVILSFAI